MERFLNSIFASAGMVAVFSLPFSWLIHVVYCLLNEQWGFLIAGAILFPIAMVHGYIIILTSIPLIVAFVGVILGLSLIIWSSKKDIF